MSWFTPTCPLDSEDKEWIENAFQWLIDELGMEILHSLKVVLPTDEFFPDPFSGSKSDILKMVERVCNYMDVDPDLVEIRFFTNEDGTNLHPLAGSESSQAANPQVLAATVAHELGHVILLGEDRLNPDYADHEPMTDLLTVYYGMGIFTANSVFSFEQWTNTFAQGWQMNRRGYLSEEMFGYALALFAYVRGESKPAWANYLQTNVKSYLKSSLKYLEKTGDTKIRRLNQPLTQPGDND